MPHYFLQVQELIELQNLGNKLEQKIRWGFYLDIDPDFMH
jgi:hypothetical protein